MLCVGVVTQFRVHAGGDVENVPRGYLKVGNPDRTHNATEELGEEVGPKVAALATPVRLEGEGGNPNTAVFWTPNPDDGNTFHAVYIDPSHLERKGNELHFKNGFVAPEGAERIVKCRFIPWYKAARLRDGLTMMAVARLLAHLSDDSDERDRSFDIE